MDDGVQCLICGEYPDADRCPRCGAAQSGAMVLLQRESVRAENAPGLFGIRKEMKHAHQRSEEWFHLISRGFRDEVVGEYRRLRMAYLPRYSALMFIGMVCTQLVGLIIGIGLVAALEWPEGLVGRLVVALIFVGIVSFPAGMVLENRLLSRPACRAPLDYLSRFRFIGMAVMSRVRDPLYYKAGFLFPAACFLAATLGTTIALLAGRL